MIDRNDGIAADRVASRSTTAKAGFKGSYGATFEFEASLEELCEAEERNHGENSATD